MAKNTNLAFDPKSLFSKAKLYVERALSEDREDNILFPFWLSLSLEFLARSTLARISQTLLADTSAASESSHLLYSLGYASTSKPKAIPMGLVLDRLTKVNIDFTKREQEICLSIVDQRNAELHSGLIGYEEFPINLWLNDYYRVCKILLISQKLTLEDFLGESEANAAQAMIDADENIIMKDVRDRISAFQKTFSSLTREEQNIKRAEAKTKLVTRPVASKLIECPACKTPALLLGALISISEPKLRDEEIERERRYLPNGLSCFACGLKISSFVELKAAGLGSQFAITDQLDPVEFHSIDVKDYLSDQYENYEPEYMDE